MLEEKAFVRLFDMFFPPVPQSWPEAYRLLEELERNVTVASVIDDCGGKCTKRCDTVNSKYLHDYELTGQLKETWAHKLIRLRKIGWYRREESLSRLERLRTTMNSFLQILKKCNGASSLERPHQILAQSTIHSGLRIQALCTNLYIARRLSRPLSIGKGKNLSSLPCDGLFASGCRC